MGRKGQTGRAKNASVRILQWVECFHTYIGVMAQANPTRTSDLLAYASLIVHAARRFKGEGWLQYDKNFRKHAETHPSARWAEANTSLWTLAFCNAQPRPSCDLCFSLDHETHQCDEYDPPEDPKKRKHSSEAPSGPMGGRTPTCHNWNRFACTSGSCRYQHICLECHQHHKEKDCPVLHRRRPASPKGKQRARDQDAGEKQPFRKKGPLPQ